ncbi:FAS-associated factor 2 [Paragonimus westermani]|uniref:FAS-associated factor 2 n=1 Tax=Paragonimus westermani TaxID=34504 RepID=A0A5J4NDZ2_9TREM|nr:FAS-associated factor 2 [Paragonimus westermani]
MAFSCEFSVEVTDPVGDVRQFIDYFKTTYVDIPLATGVSTAAASTQDASEQPSSSPTPPFFEGSYAQALQEAKRSLRFLIVYLHGDSHEDTRAFCEKTLLNEDVLRFLNNSEQLIFWGCNIKSPEGYRVSRTLRENTYPFIGVIGLTNLSASDSDRYSASTVGMGLLGRIEGAVKPIDLIQQLNSILEDNQSATIAARFDRRERETVARIREEQDLAYQQSLEQDRAKCAAREAELRTAAVMAAQQAEAAKREEALKRARAARRARWRACLPPPPSADPYTTVRLSVKMPNGQRLSRLFSLTDSVRILYYFVLSHEESPDNFEIQANFPKRVLPCQPDDESDLEDYIETEDDKATPENGVLSGRSCRSKLNDVVLDWSPKSPTSPPSFQQLGLCKPEVLFVIDKDA